MAEAKSLIDKVEAELAIKEQKLDENNKRMEKVKYALIGICLGLCVVLLLVLTGMRYIPKEQYRKALQTLEAGDYKGAAVALEKLDGYGSSEYHLETIYEQFPQYRLLGAKVGDMVTYGMYNRDKNIVPIKWYVIDKKENKALLISEDILDAQPYSGTVALSDWLDGAFRLAAFNAKESSAVTEIFLLSSEQVETYLKGKDYAACTPTTFALSRGYWSNYTGSYMWWTSDASSSGKHFLAYPGGYVGRQVDDDTDMNGIRPAVWVSFE